MPEVACAWAAGKDGAVEFRCRAPYPDPRFAAALVQVQEQSVRVLSSDLGAILVGVPRKEEFLPPKQRILMLSSPSVIFFALPR